jgi:hypothetical protein
MQPERPPARHQKDQTDLHQLRLLDIDRTPAPEDDIIFIDASTFEDQ